MRWTACLRGFRGSWRLYACLAPALLYLIVMNYAPMYGVQIAFRQYVAKRGIWGSEWVGLRHFVTFVQSVQFPVLVRNTVLLSVYCLLYTSQRLLYALLHDSIPLSMDFDHQLNNAGIQLSGPLLRVLSLSVADMNAASCTQFMAACGEIPSVYAVDMAYKNIIACVYSTQASTEPTLHARILHCCEIWAGDSFSAGLSLSLIHI